jgi:hypothetical protein
MPTGIVLATERKLTALWYYHAQGLQDTQKPVHRKSTSTDPDDLDIVYTTHERSIYRGKIDGRSSLLRQVDDLAVAFA